MSLPCTIPATFKVEIPVKPRADFSSIDMILQAKLPFIPQAGMMLSVVQDDDFREVEEVFWSPGGGLEIYFKFDDDANVKTMKKLGWREE